MTTDNITALSATVVVATYNQPYLLDFSLRSLQVQTRTDFEIVVADDGSGPETSAIVSEHQAKSAIPISYVWQEDCGFRKSRILNLAVHKAKANYLIFQDGDCIAHRRFVEGHLYCAAPGTFLVGRTPRLSRRLTQKITRADVDAGKAQRMNLAKVIDGVFGKSKKLEFGFFVGGPRLFRIVQKLKRQLGLWGGNFSCWKEDFVRVNGFNEEFVGWGQEDMELGVRFVNAGLRPVSVANRAINFHLWHPLNAAGGRRPALHREMKRAYQDSGEFRCPLGYDRHY